MSFKTFLFIVFSFSGISASAQRLISFKTETNPDRTVSIYANSQAYGEYTGRISFTSLSGFTTRSMTTQDIAIVRINRGNAEVMRFTRENSFTGPSLQYKTQYFPGRSFRKMPDTTFEYLIPSNAGNRVRVTGISSTVSPLSQKLGGEYRGTAFACKLNDTICAARGGIVFFTSDTALEAEKKETAYKSGRNRVEIQHRDGTLGNYGISSPIKLLVSSGDEVIPGQPLAVFNTESEKYRLYFSISYLDEEKLIADIGFNNNLYYVYMPAYFYGSENERPGNLQLGKEYIALRSAAIVSSEMTKREKKKFGF